MRIERARVTGIDPALQSRLAHHAHPSASDTNTIAPSVVGSEFQACFRDRERCQWGFFGPQIETWLVRICEFDALVLAGCSPVSHLQHMGHGPGWSYGTLEFGQ